MAPLLTDLNALNVTQVYLNSETALACDIVTTADDQLGANNLLGSRLIPTSVYENNVQAVVDTYKTLIESGVQGFVIQRSIYHIIESPSQNTVPPCGGRYATTRKMSYHSFRT